MVLNQIFLVSFLFSLVSVIIISKNENIEKFDYYDYEEPDYLDTERSNYTSRKPATNRTLTNRSGYIDHDYDSDHEQRRPLRLAPLEIKKSVRRKPLNVESFRRPVVLDDDHQDADDENERQRRLRAMKSSAQAPTPRVTKPYEPPRRYVLEDEDDGERITVQHVRVVKKRPHRKKVVVYHNFDEDGEEIGEPDYEVTYEDEDMYVEPEKGKSRNKKSVYDD
jgi:hypothetical protein